MVLNFSLIVLFILLSPSSKIFSQSEDSTPGLTIYSDRFITVFFPGRIKEIINTNSDLEISTSEGPKSSLQIKAKRNPGLQQTRIEIMTFDMRHFSFYVSCSNELLGSVTNTNKDSEKTHRTAALANLNPTGKQYRAARRGGK